MGVALEADQLEGAGDALTELRSGQSLNLQRQRGVSVYPPPGQERRILKDEGRGDFPPGARISLHVQLSAGRCQEPSHDTQEGGLAAPRGADDGDELSPGNF